MPHDVDSSEQHRHRCEVRQVLRWRVERGLTWVRCWLDGYIDSDGRRVPSVEQARGKAAGERLRADCREQWQRGNRGAADDWR